MVQADKVTDERLIRCGAKMVPHAFKKKRWSLNSENMFAIQVVRYAFQVVRYAFQLWHLGNHVCHRRCFSFGYSLGKSCFFGRGYCHDTGPAPRDQDYKL
jgi:hypothetical protein